STRGFGCKQNLLASAGRPRRLFRALRHDTGAAATRNGQDRVPPDRRSGVPTSRRMGLIPPLVRRRGLGLTQPLPLADLPMHTARLAGRAFARSWGRDVMLYTGGVSFFALLALFPAIPLRVGVYKAVRTLGQVSEQAPALADVTPAAARALCLNEIDRLANTSARTVSRRSAIALVIGAYAAHRGFKALLAGLNLIHGETK